jgi:hypothetical protein
MFAVGGHHHADGAVEGAAPRAQQHNDDDTDYDGNLHAIS